MPDNVDTIGIWWILCALLVFMMQLGFMLFETGFVRVRNMSGIAIKNIMMLFASTLAYTLFGYVLMFGADAFGGLLGWTRSPNDLGLEWQFYQTSFAAVAATIISGAIAERTTLRSNIIAAIVMAGLVYPIHGHWVWAENGWLNRLGVYDFAGSGVVHFVGGIAAAVGAWFAGPRKDKYNNITGEIRQYIGARSLPLASAGVIFLWIGWMGFNGGSITKAQDINQIGVFVIVTSCAAGAGAFAAMCMLPIALFKEKIDNISLSFYERVRSFYEILRQTRYFDPFYVLPGAMGGMVAVTANCALLFSITTHSNGMSVYNVNYLLVLIIGAAGGIATFLTSKFLCSEKLSFKLTDQSLKNLKSKKLPYEILNRLQSMKNKRFIRKAKFLNLLNRTTNNKLTDEDKEMILKQASRGAFHFLKIDDPVDAIAVHAGAGATGILIAGLFPENSFWIQCLELLSAGTFTIIIMGLTFFILNKFKVLRCSLRDEQSGLNFEPRIKRPPQFPFKTFYLSKDLQNDIRQFLSILTAGPMHRIRTIAYSLKEESFRNKADFSKLRRKIEREANRLKRFGEFKADYEMISMTKIVQNSFNKYRRAQEGLVSVIKPIKFKNGEKDYWVQGQEHMLEIAVDSLISNALTAVTTKAIELASIAGTNYKPEVEFILEIRGERTALCIRDNGGGIPDSVLAMLYEPFPDRESSTGFGLGLYFSALVMETFQGELNLLESDHNGTTFEIILYNFEEENHGKKA